MDDYQKPDKLEKAESKLYSPNTQIEKKERSRLYEEKHDVQSVWAEENTEEEKEENTLKKESKKGMSIFTKILLVALLFFVGALSYAAFIFFYKTGPEGRNVDITINSAVSIGAGEEYTFDVIIENNNPVDMQAVDLIIEYPEGTRDGTDVSINLPREKYSIGDIKSGTFLRETKNIFLFGEEGDTKEVEVKIVYNVSDSNAIFEKKKVFDVVLKSTPVRMNISSAGEITTGQELEFDVELISNANETLNDVLVKVEYPFGFIYRSATLEPLENKNTWVIDKLEPKETLKFTVKGELQGQNNEDKFFRFSTGLKDPDKEENINVVFSSIGKTVVISRPFLEIDMAVNGQNSSVINLQSDRVYSLSVNYRNNTNEILRDAKIILNLEGEVLDENKINVSKGFYDSLNNDIIWDKTTEPRLGEIALGESGELTVSLGSKNLLEEIQIKNPEISLSAKVEGLRPESQNVPETIFNEVFKTLRFNTVVVMNADSFYRNGPFVNSGYLPPKVEEETTYTIMFNLLNSSNTISSAKVEMHLPNYVIYKGETWPSGTDVYFDSSQRKVTWNIGNFKELTGFADDGPKAAFQVGIIPSITQRGSSPILVEDIIFTGIDLFTGEQIKLDSKDLSIRISDSENYYEGSVTQ